MEPSELDLSSQNYKVPSLFGPSQKNLEFSLSLCNHLCLVILFPLLCDSPAVSHCYLVIPHLYYLSPSESFCAGF